MPTLVEILQGLTQASEALTTAAGEAAQARLDFNASNEAKEAAEAALVDAKATHTAALAALDELT